MRYDLLNGANLAYIGDAYFELVIRKYLIDKGITKNKELKKMSLKFVSATSHNTIYEKIKTIFTEEEQKIFLRGRNNAPSSHRKNVDQASYVVSTGLEAVIGYLYLQEKYDRLDQIMDLIIQKGEER